jgi:hypothetical protein
VPFRSPNDAAAALRAGDPSILARTIDDRVVFDLRTVPESRDADIARRIGEIVSSES